MNQVVGTIMSKASNWENGYGFTDMTPRDIDKEAMLHVEGREPRLIVKKAIELHKPQLMDQKVS